MSGWVKWEKDLETDIRFTRLCRQVRDTCHAGALRGVLHQNAVVALTMGALVKLWSYADTHIRADDTLDLSFDDIDELVGVTGFAAAMPEDWLIKRGDQCVELPGFQEHNGTIAKKRDLNTKRQQRRRARQNEEPVTPEGDKCHAGALPDQTRLDQTNKNTSASKPPRRAKRVPRETDPEWLLDFKIAYPNRAGDPEWRKAVKAANARLAEGHTTDQFIAGAKRYAAYCEAVESTGTQFVKSAATFLGPGKHFLEQHTPPAPRPPNGKQPGNPYANAI